MPTCCTFFMRLLTNIHPSEVLCKRVRLLGQGNGLGGGGLRSSTHVNCNISFHPFPLAHQYHDLCDMKYGCWAQSTWCKNDPGVPNTKSFKSFTQEATEFITTSRDVEKHIFDGPKDCFSRRYAFVCRLIFCLGVWVEALLSAHGHSHSSVHLLLSYARIRRAQVSGRVGVWYTSTSASSFVFT